MKVLELVAENFKKIRIVEIQPKGHVVQLTGKNGQGKTSVLDALWFVLKGQKALPLKAVRKGAERMKVQLKTVEFTVTRTLAANGTLPTMELKMNKGFEQDGTPQKFLDSIIGDLAFDPLEFIRMDPKARVETLRKAVKLDVDVDDLNNANTLDYAERALVNKEVKQLEGQLAGMVTLEGLPQEKLDEAAILKQLNEAGEANRKAQEVFRAKQALGAQVGVARSAFENNERTVETQTHRITELELQLKTAKDALKAAQGQSRELGKALHNAETAYEAAPSGEPVDVGALTAELQAAQRTNRAIDDRTQYDAVKAKLDAKTKEARSFTTKMENREEQKRNALANAKMPIEGIAFGDTDVIYNGLPLENLGEGEAIKVSARIGMALNPKMRVMRIPHGEALDESGLAILAQLAEENDFQIWMARVDSSGKVGLVLEDGMIVARNEEA
jgi:DNA repair exonuclease SbcCD ATPase subunit